MDVIRRCRPSLLALALLLLGLSLPRLAAADARPSATTTAAKVDAALVRGLSPNVRLPATVDDETFLRRVSLDLTGKLPDPDAKRRFVADAAPEKGTATATRSPHSLSAS